MTGKRTLVKLDLKGYAQLAKLIEAVTGPKGTSRLNSTISGWIEEALIQVGSEKGGNLGRGEGDSALLSFLYADDAHRFSKLIHENLRKWNREQSTATSISEIKFRIGCATGEEIDLDTHHGTLNTIAYRLEPKSYPGGILIDLQTYNDLSAEFQKEYDSPEIIFGKRHERYRVRRWLGNRRNTKIENRILDIPEIENKNIYSFETVTLNGRGEQILCESRTADYIVEDLKEQIIKMILIPSGEYGMGSTEKKAPNTEKPQHLVKVPAFLMSQFPITKAQWRAVSTYPKVNRELKKSTSSTGARNSPVVYVSWYDAVEFCDRLSMKTGRLYRLPSESEWEYACRAGTYTEFNLGDSITSQYVNYDARSPYCLEPLGIYRGKTSTIAEFHFSNQFGLFDMHGNVWEWCLDHWHDDYQSAPEDGSSWIDSSHNLMRVLRGGSWISQAKDCRSSRRLYHDESDNFSHDISFRLVCQIN
jgi:formylglycine-generating enzyme required for sulfatase activity/class 3 adenylate cyclase